VKYEIAGLERLGVVDLFRNFFRGVQKTFFPAKIGPAESIIPSQTVFVYQPKPETPSSDPSPGSSSSPGEGPLPTSMFCNAQFFYRIKTNSF
jgi:hypothetical protein